MTGFDRPRFPSSTVGFLKRRKGK